MPQAVYINNGRIQALGSVEEVFAHKDSSTEVVDLCGGALFPGFIDCCGQLTSRAGLIDMVDLSDAVDFEDIVSRLKDCICGFAVADGQWVIGMNYDHSFLAEKDQPDRALLDQLCAKHPILITHASLRMGVFNSQALEKLGLAGEARTRHEEQYRSGRVEGEAFELALSRMPRPDQSEFNMRIDRVQDQYLRLGVTSVQECGTTREQWERLLWVAQKRALRLDMICSPDAGVQPDLYEQPPERSAGVGMLRFGGLRFKLGGACAQADPCGTIWRFESEPGQSGNSFAEGGQIEQDLKNCVSRGLRPIAACCDEAAVERFLHACESSERQPERPLLFCERISAQLLARANALGAVVGFAPYDAIFCAQENETVLERLHTLCPVASAQQAGVPVAFHREQCAWPPDPIGNVYSAVNRLDKKGKSLCSQERVEILPAFASITRDAAFACMLEGHKGTIAMGKDADLVTFWEDPLKIDPLELRSLRVRETIVRGRVAYQAQK